MTYFSKDDYMAHGGTGFGKRDYSCFDFEMFSDLVYSGFKKSSDSEQRLNSIINAFKLASGEGCADWKRPFVCKAPHNEIHSEKWAAMLKDRGQYIISTRVPTEHFVSLNNISKISGSPKQSTLRYVDTVILRVEMWKNFPSQDTIVIDYDNLIKNTDQVMKMLCEFIGVKKEPINSYPSKMKVEWAGNSSRGLVHEMVFANPHIAKQVLPRSTVVLIEQNLPDLYSRFGWSFLYNASMLDKVFARAALNVSRAHARVRKFSVDFIKSHAPQKMQVLLKQIFRFLAVFR